MEQKISLEEHPIFYSISHEEILLLKNCFHFLERSFRKQDYILMEGDEIHQIGLILSGTILMEKVGISGNYSFVTELKKGDILAEPFMGNHVICSSVNYKAVTPCNILFFEYRDMWQPCNKNCRFHSKFTQNLMNLLALKTRSMMAKIELLSQKTLREKIFLFLQLEKSKESLTNFKPDPSFPKLVENQVYVPFNHTELAEYLCVNRSSLVRELGHLKKDCLLSCKNHIYTLH